MKTTAGGSIEDPTLFESAKSFRRLVEKDLRISGKYWREQWYPGETPFFEYHCYEGHDSADAQLWYRSQQKVTIIDEDKTSDGFHLGGTALQRLKEFGAPKVYRIRFLDGFVGDATEDELLLSPKGYSRKPPPKEAR